MRQPFSGQLVVFANALLLSACAATHPAGSNGTPSANAAIPATAAPATNNDPKAYGNYVRVVRKGQTLYCQKDLDTGTRMVHETCLTQAQAQAQQDNARNFMQSAQGIANTPVSPIAH